MLGWDSQCFECVFLIFYFILCFAGLSFSSCFEIVVGNEINFYFVLCHLSDRYFPIYIHLLGLPVSVGT